MTVRAERWGTVRIGGELEVARLAYGAMRLTGQPGNWGPYPDPGRRHPRLRRAVELGRDADRHRPCLWAGLQ